MFACFFSSQLPYGGFSKLKSKQQPTRKEKKITDLCPCPPECVFGHDVLWRLGFGRALGDPTCQNPTLLSGPGAEILGLGVLKNVIGQMQSASHITAGDLFLYL